MTSHASRPASTLHSSPALVDATVVIVGGSSGIGLGVARASLARGAKVVLVGRTAERLARAAAWLEAGERVSVHAADATDERSVQHLFGVIGPFDHLVVTAVVGAYAPIRQLSLDDARRLIESKLVAALALAKHGAAHVRPGGSMTFTSGIAKDRPMPGGAVVAAVNGGLGALAHALALELAPTRVNVVSPGWVDTPVWDAIAGEGKIAAWDALAKKLPVGRIGTPHDLALAYLAAMENGFMTGTTLHVDGGHALV